METKSISPKRTGDFTVTRNDRFSDLYSLLILEAPDREALTEIKPGQFVQVKTPENATFLRRPISVCNVDHAKGHLWLLVRNAGDGTAAINRSQPGDKINIIYPLGRGFSVNHHEQTSSTLLIGGGVGVAPLLFLAATLNEQGIKPTVLLGARSSTDVLLRENFAELADLHISTEDGSEGQRGLVTTNTILERPFDRIYCCGPMPMMKAVASIARKRNIDCEVSLENVMGCGIGACLCCVEKTTAGNVCVCSEGPVFNIKELLWQD